MMDEVTPRILNRKTLSSSMGKENNDSIGRMSRQFENLQTSTTTTTTAAAAVDEEEKNSEATTTTTTNPNPNPNHFYSSKKCGLIAASTTSAFIKPPIGNTTTTATTTTTTTTTDNNTEKIARQVVAKLQQEALLAASNKTTTTTTGTTPFHRRASPIARMRDNSVQEAASMNAVDSHGLRFKMAATTTSSSSQNKNKKEPISDKEMKKEKRRKWKKKMKIAQAKKRQERRNLDDNNTVMSSSQFGGSRSNPVYSCVLDNVEGTKLFARFTQCAGATLDDGAASEYEEYSEYGGSSAGSTGIGYYSDDYDDDDEEDESALSASVPRRNGKQQRQRGRSRKSRQKPPSSRESSTDRSSMGTSVDTTVLEEMTASFISTGDDTTVYGEQSEKQQQRQNSTKIKSSLEVPLAATIATSGLGNSSNPTDYAAFVSGMSAVQPSFDPFKIEDNIINNENSAIPSTQKPVVAPRFGTNRHLSSSGTNIKSRNPTTTNSQSESSFVKNFIEDFKNNGEPMLWHQETSAMNPMNVTIRLKKGFVSDGTYCAPRLIWTDPRKDQNYGLDIFDIQSLERADVLLVQLENFPCAMPGRSVCLHLKNSTSFIFEAGTEEDALRFVRGVRWVVARLAYNLVIGNLDVSCELLELGLMDARSPRSTLMEFDWSRAMDDVTEHLVEKTLSSTMI
ncbi:MAG: hypothetical protein ACI8RD_002926 [Bacillariaceae sp.]|jgi:hypothetical protein